MAKSTALAADPSRLASLLLSYISAVCAFVASRHPGASAAIIDRLSHSRAHRLEQGHVAGSAASLASRSAALALAFALWAAAAAAQAPAASAPPAAPPAARTLDIEWSGPEDCERGAAVQAKVLRLLGGSQRVFSAPVKVAVTVHREKGSRYVAELETTTSAGGGSKRLEGESCDAIALASSVVIALSIDPNASLDAAPPEEPPPPPPKVASRRPPPPRPRVPPKRQTFPYLHGSVGVVFGVLSAPSAFTAAGIGARHRRFSLELGGAVYQPRDVRRDDRPKVGAQLRVASGELLGCYAALPFQLGAVELCPGVRFEYVSARAFGVSDPATGSVLLASGVGVVRGRLRATSWLSATLDAGAEARPFQPKFVLRGVGDVFEIPAFSAFARTGLVLEF
jgi:hypothetical protein